MLIHLYDGSFVKAWKIEPSIKSGYLVINKEYSIAIAEIHCIIPDQD